MSYTGETKRMLGELVSGSYYDVLGVRAAAGRLISPDDDRIGGAAPVAVLSYDYWQSRFGGDRRIVGQTIRLNNLPVTVIGVSQAGFYGVDLGSSPQVMVPVTLKKQLTQGRTIWRTGGRAGRRSLGG